MPKPTLSLKLNEFTEKKLRRPCIVGCSHQAPKGGSYRQPAFFEDEIRSKSWTGLEGRPLRLLDWSIVNLQEQGEMLIARFGETNTGYATCLEFYQVYREPEGYFLVQLEKATASTNTAVTMERKLIPERVLFLLLEHDLKPGMVKSVETRREQGRTYFTIIRETIPGMGKPRQGLRYVLVYDKDFKLHEDLSAWSWDISD